MTFILIGVSVAVLNLVSHGELYGRYILRSREWQPYIKTKINLFQILITIWAKIVKCVIIQETLKIFLHELKSLTGIKSCRYVKFSDIYIFSQLA